MGWYNFKLAVWFYVIYYDAERLPTEDRRGLRCSMCFHLIQNNWKSNYTAWVLLTIIKEVKNMQCLYWKECKSTLHKRLNSTTYVLHLQIIRQPVLYTSWKPVQLPNWNTTLHCITDAMSFLCIFASLWSTNYSYPVYSYLWNSQRTAEQNFIISDTGEYS